MTAGVPDPVGYAPGRPAARGLTCALALFGTLTLHLGVRAQPSSLPAARPETPRLAAFRRHLDTLDAEGQRRFETWRDRYVRLVRTARPDARWQQDLDTLAREIEDTLATNLRALQAPSHLSPIPSSEPLAPEQASVLEAEAARLRTRERRARRDRVRLSAAALRAVLRLEARLGPPAHLLPRDTPALERLAARLRQTGRLIEAHLRWRLVELSALSTGLSPNRVQALWRALAGALFLLVLFAWGLRRLDRLQRALHVAIGRRIRSPNLRLQVQRWLRLAVALLPSLGLVLLVEGMALALSPLHLGEVRLARALLLLWAWYRVVRQAVLHLLTTWAAARDDILGPQVRLRILRSLRRLGRTVVTCGGVLISLDAIEGPGPVFRLAEVVTLLLLIVVAFWVLASWRLEVLAAWRARYPQGLFSGLAEEQARGPTAQTGAALLLGLLLLTLGLIRWTRDLALRFGRLRRLFAAVERRALERRGEVADAGDAALAQLPDTLHDALAPGPVDLREAIANFPGLETAQRFFAARADLGAGGSLALVGEPGSGRRTWLMALAHASADVPTTEVTLRTRPRSAGEVPSLLIQALDLPADTPPTPDGVVTALEARPLTRIVVRNARRLVLRAMGGLRPFETFVEIVGRSAERVQWICVFPDTLWRLLCRIYPDQLLFQQVVTLPPWSEAQIDALIESRMRRARVQPRYQASVVDHLEGTAFDAEVVHTARRYHRLIWDYSDGNPRAALHFWTRSLAVGAEGEVVVRLFQAPDPKVLERLDERSRFLLAAVTLHDGLSVDEAAHATGYPRASAEAVLESLREQGILEERERTHRLSTHWQRAVLRTLRHRRLLPAG